MPVPGRHSPNIIDGGFLMKRVLELFGYEKACLPLKQLQGKHAEKYTHFRELLNHNHREPSLMPFSPQITST
jgi:hypothetical protein